MTKVLIFGGRDCNEHKVMAWLEAHFTDVLVERGLRLAPLHIIVGGQRGADNGGLLWGLAWGYQVQVFKADWKKSGKAAGPLRNQRMLNERPDLGIGFPGGRGTADMTRRLLAAKVPVHSVTEGMS